MQRAFNLTPIKMVDGSPVLMRDVGEVQDAGQIHTKIVRTNGARQVYIPIYRQPGANTIEIVDAIKARLAQILDRLKDNDALLDVGVAYYELARSQLRVAIAREAIANAEELVELTENFVQAGAGRQADVVRARAQLADARGAVLEAQEDVRVNSAELARRAVELVTRSILTSRELT